MNVSALWEPFSTLHWVFTVYTEGEETIRQELRQEKRGRGKIYCASKRIKYVLTAFWPEGQNTEIVASGCQAGVTPFTREQTFSRPRLGKHHTPLQSTDNVVSDR